VGLKADMHRQSLTEIILSRARERPGQAAIRFARADTAAELSWTDIDEVVRDLVLGLETLGLERGDRVGLMSHNRWEWIALDLAAMGQGMVTVSIDPGWSDNLVVRILNHARVRCVCVETVAAARRLMALAKQLPCLRATVIIDPPAESPTGTTTFAALRDAGRAGRTADPARVDERLASVRGEDLAMIIHTGGSTGEPKGVLRTHGNTASVGWAFFPWLGDTARPFPEGETVVFNPLSFSHSAGRFWYQTTLALGATVALPAGGDVSLRELALLSPTHAVTVPRVVLRLQKLLLPHVQRSWAEMAEVSPPEPRGAKLRREISTQVQSLVGHRLRCMICGGGPVAASLRAFFEEGCGIRLIAGYGGTEQGIISMCGGDGRPGTVGRPAGAHVCVEGGEILVRGPGVSPGYLNNPAATGLAKTGDGWWRTGDLGALDEEGNLTILGRLRAMFNCSEGTNIDPTEIEQLLESDPYVREAILIGHRRPFLSALIVPDRDRLIAEGIADVTAFLQERFDRMNRCLEDFEKVRGLRLIEGSFPAKVRHVTAANKIRIERELVEELYAEEIGNLYRDAG
jgi:long-chain acyl-CoA synthetase